MRTALLYNFLIEANLMACIAIPLMMLLRRFLRRQMGNGALCFGWLLVALRLLLPLSLPNPLINAIRSPFAMDQAIRPIAGQVKVRLDDAMRSLGWRLWSEPEGVLHWAGNGLVSLSGGLENATLSMRLANLYALGVLAVAGWFVFSNARFRRRLRAARIEPISGRLLEQYTALCAARGVKPVPVYFADPLPSACLVGALRPYIALPLTASPQDAIRVLTHEVCHLKNRDNLWGLLRLFCCALHWFNPLVWMAAAMSRTDGELRCDDRVVAGMEADEKRAYANVLVLAAARRSAPGLGVLATGMTMTGRRLKTRVAAIVQSARPLRGLSVAFLLLSSMCLAGAFATSEVRVVPRLFRSHPAISRTTITSETEAAEYARTLYGLLGGTAENDLRWQVENAADDPDEVYAYSLDGDRNLVFGATFDRAGNVKSLEWRQLFEEDWAMDLDVTLTAEEQDKLAADVLALIGDINPAVAGRCRVYEFVAESVAAAGEKTVDLAFWRSGTARENNDDVDAFVRVQLYPQVRVLDFNIWYGSAYGNG